MATRAKMRVKKIKLCIKMNLRGFKDKRKDKRIKWNRIIT